MAFNTCTRFRYDSLTFLCTLHPTPIPSRSLRPMPERLPPGWNARTLVLLPHSVELCPDQSPKDFLKEKSLPPQTRFHARLHMVSNTCCREQYKSTYLDCLRNSCGSRSRQQTARRNRNAICRRRSSEVLSCFDTASTDSTTSRRKTNRTARPTELSQRYPV
jgi:hypothetical protein